MQRKGSVKWFSLEKRYGFVTLEDPTEDALLPLQIVLDFNGEFNGDSEVWKGAPVIVETARSQEGLAVTKLIDIGKKPPEPTDADYVRATCKWFNATKGFGFVTRGPGTPDVFVHAVTLKEAAIETLYPDEPVMIIVDEQGQRGPKVSRAKAV